MDIVQNPAVETRYDFGSFEGFNFREQAAIEKLLTTIEVLNWDHDLMGEAEFWPSGDNPWVSLIFENRSSVTASELLELDRILVETGADGDCDFVKIYYALHVSGNRLEDLSARSLDDLNLHTFYGSNFTDVRKDAAYELFELYYPETYVAWQESLCDGLIFDVDRFLDSPAFSTVELKLEGRAVLIVTTE